MALRLRQAGDLPVAGEAQLRQARTRQDAQAGKQGLEHVLHGRRADQQGFLRRRDD